MNAKYLVNEITDFLSDHYPAIAEFKSDELGQVPRLPNLFYIYDLLVPWLSYYPKREGRSIPE